MKSRLCYSSVSLCVSAPVQVAADAETAHVEVVEHAVQRRLRLVRVFVAAGNSKSSLCVQQRGSERSFRLRSASKQPTLKSSSSRYSGAYDLSAPATASRLSSSSGRGRGREDFSSSVATVKGGAQSARISHLTSCHSPLHCSN